jgi:serine/threonine-protein kinase
MYREPVSLSRDRQETSVDRSDCAKLAGFVTADRRHALRSKTERMLPLANANEPIRDPLAGTWINGRFHLVASIARGGMGSVYLAEQAPLGRVCAVKILHPHCAGDPRGAFEKRFWLEASVTSALNHPNIVTVFECGSTASDLRYMAMEYLVGRTLGRAIRETGRLHEPRVVHVASQICRALHSAHAAGVVHRDLKPNNVFLVERENELEVAKVLDFGLVRDLTADPRERLTEGNLVLGSPRYMAPEQIRGEAVDARTDVYALGIVMYEMIAGTVPFDGPNCGRILEAHLKHEVPRLPRGDGRAAPTRRLEAIVRRCLEKEPAQRFSSMADVLTALEAHGEVIGRTRSRTLGHSDGARSRIHERAGRAESFVRRRRPPRRAWPALRPFAFALAIAASASLADRIWQPSNVREAEASAGATPGRHPSGQGRSPDGARLGVQASRVGPAPVPDPTVAVQVTTVPSDSSVREGDVELCRATPCAIVYEGAEASPDAVHVLTVARDGYRTETRTIRPIEGPVEIVLVQAAMRRPPPPPPPRTRDPPPLSAYRLDVPY